MSSLQAHLERHDLAVNPLEFRRDCPLCRAERVQGQLPSASLVPPRACAAMTAAVLATSARRRAARRRRNGHRLGHGRTPRRARGDREARQLPVRLGDSLWRIAGSHLGSGATATATATAQEVTRLWELNRQRIGTGNPDLIFPGQTLKM